jgi:hypothetical protein
MTSIHHQLGLTIGGHALLATHGEAVVYWPLNGQPRSIQAIVERATPAPLDTQSPRSRATNNVTVRALNCEIDGISTRELDVGGDEIELARRLGEDTERRPIKAIVGQDGGMLSLEVR